MRILVQLSHPAHFHFYRYSIENWKRDGHEVFILIKTKDILESLLEEAGIPYYNINENVHRGSKFGMLWDMVVRDWRVLCFCVKHKIDLLTGSTVEVAHVGWLLRKPAICVGEDDAATIPLFVKSIKPFLQVRLSPVTCRCGSLENKTIHYAGFMKLAYLHPNKFTSEVKVLAKYGISTEKPFFLVRFASLRAHHDTGINGFSTEKAQGLINVLSKYGDIYITSERELEPQFEKYRLHINPLEIHHVMAFAKMYIGDSQSMAVEAAMLGVPSLRFNDFAGKIGVLEELERKYELTYGIPSSQPQLLYEKVKALLACGDLYEIFQARRQKMLSDKIDVTAFFTWFIEKYPASHEIMRRDPDYQFNFTVQKSNAHCG